MSKQTMREKLARALCRRAGHNPDEDGHDGDPLWRLYRRDVDAILAVLAEPDEGMIEAALEEYGKCTSPTRLGPLSAAFTAAINHIRKDGEAAE